jgi:putative ABC transport system permease protein
VVGIVISTFLIGQQVGIFTFLTGLMSALVDNSQRRYMGGGCQNTGCQLTRPARCAYRQGSTPVSKASLLLTAWRWPMEQASLPDGKSSPVLMIGSEAPAFAAGPRAR